MTRLADPIAMEVFSNRLLSITEDMGSTLIRSSFSTNIKERKDCSVGLFDAARPADRAGLAHPAASRLAAGQRPGGAGAPRRGAACATAMRSC